MGGAVVNPNLEAHVLCLPTHFQSSYRLCVVQKTGASVSVLHEIHDELVRATPVVSDVEGSAPRTGFHHVTCNKTSR